MSWSAFACRVTKDAWGPSKDDMFPIEAGDAALPAFEAAASRLELEVGDVDPRFSAGRLSLKDCLHMFNEATGNIGHSGRWSPAEVKVLAAKANWSFGVDNEAIPAWASARAFLNLCAEHGLGLEHD